MHQTYCGRTAMSVLPMSCFYTCAACSEQTGDRLTSVAVLVPVIVQTRVQFAVGLVRCGADEKCGLWTAYAR